MKDNFENCGYYTGSECNICGMGIDGEDTFCRLCKDNPKCYYKQLSELKADNKHLNDLLDNALKEQEELREEIKQLHNGRNPEELYTLFGKPIKYWEELKAENERLRAENKELCERMATVTYRATG